MNICNPLYLSERVFFICAIFLSIPPLLLDNYHGASFILVFILYIYKEYRRFPFVKSKFLYSHTLFLVFIILLFILSSIETAIFYTTHIVLIYSGLIFFHKLASRHTQIQNINPFFYFIVTCICLLQYFHFLPSSHYPRVSSIFLSPNSLSAFGVFALTINYQLLRFKGTISYLQALIFAISGGSAAIIPAILLTLKRKGLLIISSIIIIYTIFAPTILFDLSSIFVRIFDFIDMFTSADIYSEWDGITSLSAFRRVTYLRELLGTIYNFDNYTLIREISFAEGAIPTLATVSPIIALLLCFDVLKQAIKLFKNKKYAAVWLILVWAFLTPIITPLFLFFLDNSKKTYLGQDTSSPKFSSVIPER